MSTALREARRDPGPFLFFDMTVLWVYNSSMAENPVKSVHSMVSSRRCEPDVRTERRNDLRRPCDDVIVHLVDDDGTMVPFESFDLNHGGMFLRSELLMYPGDEVVLQLEVPGVPTPLLVIGRVVHVGIDENGNASGMGVSFWSLTGTERAILRNYISPGSRTARCA